jgi:hypothetical protein
VSPIVEVVSRMSNPRAKMSFSRGMVTWADGPTPVVGRARVEMAPAYASTPNDGEGARGGLSSLPESRVFGAEEDDPREYVNVTDLRIQHLTEMLEAERRLNRVVDQYSKGGRDGDMGREEGTDYEVRDMSVDVSMPRLERMVPEYDLEGRGPDQSHVKELHKKAATTAEKISRASQEMSDWMVAPTIKKEKVVEPNISEKEVVEKVTENNETDAEDELTEEKARKKGRSTTAGSAPRMKPSQYDGLTPYEDYRVQFQMLAELNGWTEKVKALYLAGCLSKGARSVLNDMIPAERYVYEKLDGALRGRYGTDDQAELFKAKLRSRIKSKDESLQQLASGASGVPESCHANT